MPFIRKKITLCAISAVIMSTSLAAQAQLLPLVSRPFPEAYVNYFPGNYYKTCQACHFNPSSGLLSCDCLDREHAYRNQPTQMYVSRQCRYIENIDGQLRCTDYTNQTQPEPYGWRNLPRYKLITHSINAGPIWNNQDAKNRCPIVCDTAHGHWDGNWRTVITASRSECDCQYHIRLPN